MIVLSFSLSVIVTASGLSTSDFAMNSIRSFMSHLPRAFSAHFGRGGGLRLFPFLRARLRSGLLGGTLSPSLGEDLHLRGAFLRHHLALADLLPVREDPDLRKDSIHRVGEYRTVAHPLESASAIHLHHSRLLQGVVEADFFDGAAIAPHARVSHDDLVERRVRGPAPLQADLYRHPSPPGGSEGPRVCVFISEAGRRLT